MNSLALSLSYEEDDDLREELNVPRAEPGQEEEPSKEELPHGFLYSSFIEERY